MRLSKERVKHMAETLDHLVHPCDHPALAEAIQWKRQPHNRT